MDGGYGAHTIINKAKIYDFDQVDPNTADNTSSVSMLVNGADLQVTKTVSNPAPNPLDNITYTIVIYNNGPLKANDITLTDILPSGVTYVSSTISQGNPYNSVNGTWFANDINALASATLTITAQVKAAGITLGSSLPITPVRPLLPLAKPTWASPKRHQRLGMP
ncbi:MAG: DUF11 domain-containing protein [Saprospirales bacterium]|nr:DUF11 domain-containing protein [Saprospirales bacterium]